ncbi:extracellular leucine-rich repeat and fibronectin type III domain containing 2a [Gouania willdenowi]|uniref:extracellular leucine-rich repeat and fibronectin type III domain containing 2a n=1 Tax=Gouania willdenowi TaxID=441366 RepID=UPI001055262E|nr:protein phosphatase 1 regulatory subunit 29-like [Gouania willdenowi]
MAGLCSRFLPASSLLVCLLLPTLLLLNLPGVVKGDCWLIEGDKGYVWLAICSQNQPPYETIPQHINSTVHDLRLNENKIKAVLFISMYRFTNLTDLNLTKNEISYIEDGAFAGQANLQVLQLGYNKMTNLTEGMLRGLGRMQCLFLQHNLIEVIATNAFWECPNLNSLDLSSNKLSRLDPSTFTTLARLMVCELAGNPFHCGCDLYSFLTWLEEFNNVTHTYDRLQCETPPEMTGYPLLSPVPGHGRNARFILLSMCRRGALFPGLTSQMPDSDGSGMGMDNPDQGLYHQPVINSTPDPNYNHQISLKLQSVSLSTASLIVQIPRPYSKMYILSKINHTFSEDIMPLKNKKDIIHLDKLKPHTNYTYCVASAGKTQRYNHTCLSFSTRAIEPGDARTNPSTTTHYIMTILGCLFGMVIVLGVVYYCLRRRRIQEEKEKAISVKKTILEMRYGPEAAAAVANDPGAMQRLQEQAHHQHHHSGGGGGKLPQSASSSTGMLHGSTNTSSSRLSTLPQVEKMATAFTEAIGGKSNYMDVRTGLAVDGREAVGAGGASGVGGEVVVDMRGGAENGLEAGEDSDDDGHGSASEISTIAKEVDKVNQIINNCIDALKLDASAGAVTTADNVTSVSSPQPPCIASLPRNLLPLSPGHPNDQIMASSPKIHTKAHTQQHLQPHIPPHPQQHPQAHPQAHTQIHPQLHQQPHPSMAPVPLVMPLSERPGISGGGFLSPPYRDPPPANAVRPLQRQLSADTAVGKNRCGGPPPGSVKNTRVYSVDIPEPRSDPPPKYPIEKGSPVGCSGGSGSGGGGGMGCNGNGMGNVNGGGVNLNGGGMGCSNGSGGGVVKPGQQQHHLEVQPDYHSSEHRHSFPALYSEGGCESPTPAQKASFLKPLGRTKRDATAAYSQLSPSRHHNYNSGYSSSPEYSSESTLRIWERFRPYKKNPREEASYIAAGHALRKKVQFAKDEDLHDILDYWKGVSAQQKL